MFFNASPIDIHLARRLREIRSHSGFTQDELGELIGVSFQQIQKYETALNKLSASKLYEICRVLKKPISSFFENINIEDGYYNFKFTSEENTEYEDNLHKKEVRNLVKLFNQAKNDDVRENIINLVESIVKAK